MKQILALAATMMLLFVFVQSNQSAGFSANTVRSGIKAQDDTATIFLLPNGAARYETGTGCQARKMTATSESDLFSEDNLNEERQYREQQRTERDKRLKDAFDNYGGATEDRSDALQNRVAELFATPSTYYGNSRVAEQANTTATVLLVVLFLTLAAASYLVTLSVRKAMQKRQEK